MRVLTITVVAGVSLVGQQRTPREELNPRTYRELTSSPLNQMMDQMTAITRRTESKLDAVSSQYAYLSEQQKVIMQQMQMVLDIRKQVDVDTERLNSVDSRVSTLEGRFQRREDQNEARSIAVLETKVDAIAKTAVWLLCGVGSLVLGAITFLLKRQLTALLRRKGFRV